MARRRQISKSKFKLVLGAFSECLTIQESGRKYEFHPAQINNWKTQL